MTLAFLVDAYDEEVVGQDKNGKDDVRTVLRLHPRPGALQVRRAPLSKKLGPRRPGDPADAGEGLYGGLRRGRLHRQALPPPGRDRHPYCVTVDFETVGDGEKAADHCVTVRDRDTMEQVRLPIDQLKAYLQEKMAF